MKVFVVTRNDFPDSVFADEAAALFYAEGRERQEFKESGPFIRWRVYGFEVREVPDEKAQYEAYVAACHAKLGVFVSEFNFKEWIEAGKPSGEQ